MVNLDHWNPKSQIRFLDFVDSFLRNAEFVEVDKQHAHSESSNDKKIYLGSL